MYYFNTRKIVIIVNINRHSASVVLDRNRIVFIYSYHDAFTVSRKSLVNGIVDYLVYEMVKAARASFCTMFMASAVFPIENRTEIGRAHV